MTIETSTYIADWNAAYPANTDSKSEGDDHIRKIKTDLQATLPGFAGRFRRIQTKSGAYTAVLNDNSSILRTSGTWTLSGTAVATLGNGWEIIVYNDGSGTITFDPSGAELVNGAATLTIAASTWACIWCDGSAFRAIGGRTDSINIATTDTAQTLTSKTLTSPTINTPTISGGTITGMTDIAVADGGTGASTAAGARTNLGLTALATRIYTANATYTPDFTGNVLVLTVGGGGGGGGGGQGGGNNAGGGGGGGAGGEHKYSIKAVTSGSNYSIVVGSGGAGGSAASTGSSGNSSSFAADVLSAGGAGGNNGGTPTAGTGATSSGSAGGAAGASAAAGSSGAALSRSGGNGGNGGTSAGNGGGGGGGGGASIFIYGGAGGAGAADNTAGASAGVAGAYGSGGGGGGGAGYNNTTAGAAGGAGGNGVVVVYELN